MEFESDCRKPRMELVMVVAYLLKGTEFEIYYWGWAKELLALGASLLKGLEFGTFPWESGRELESRPGSSSLNWLRLV